jgi:hypothetical protein
MSAQGKTMQALDSEAVSPFYVSFELTMEAYNKNVVKESLHI